MIASHETGGKADPVRILIVDDQADIRMLLRMIIRSADVELVVGGEASSGEAALATLDDVDPGVIILDEMMPGLSGIETAVRIRERRRGQVIVMCSARSDGDLQDRAEAVGINAFLPKDRITENAETIRGLTA